MTSDSLDWYYDRQGRKITMLQWAARIEDHSPEGEAYRIVAQHQVGEAWVSTVWVGLDHAFGGGPPLIFETWVKWPGGRLEDEMERYSTEAQAWEGHAVMVQRVREVQGEPVTVRWKSVIPEPDRRARP